MVAVSEARHEGYVGYCKCRVAGYGAVGLLDSTALKGAPMSTVKFCMGWWVNGDVGHVAEIEYCVAAQCAMLWGVLRPVQGKRGAPMSTVKSCVGRGAVRCGKCA